MKIRRTSLPGVLLIDVDVFTDERGCLFEAYQTERYGASGITVRFVQDNVSFSKCGVLRGLHLQHPHPQIKLVTVLAGEILDVAVDIRIGSPRFGHWASAILSAENHRQMLIPEGFAHGFCVLSETAIVMYKVSDRHNPDTAMAVAWNDPDIGVHWPIDDPVLSAKDARAPRLRDIATDRLPGYLGRG